MTKINFTTETLSVKGEDLTPFYEITDAINKFGKFISVCTIAENGERVEDIHEYENYNAHITGNIFIIIEKMGRVKSGVYYGAVCGFRSNLVNFDGYEISKSGVKLHKRNGTTLHIIKKRSA